MSRIPEIPRKDFTVARHILMILYYLERENGFSKSGLVRKFSIEYREISVAIDRAVKLGLVLQSSLGQGYWFTITKNGVEVLRQWKSIESSLGIERGLIR